MEKRSFLWYRRPIPAAGVSADLVFGGDFCPIRRFEKKILDGQDIFDDYLLETFLRADLTVMNLEAPLCDATLPAAAPSGYGLRADPRCADYLKKLGRVVTGLANNHLKDFREEGALQTMKNLASRAVLHTGAGRDLEEANRPLFLDVNGLRICVWALAEKEFNLAGENIAGTGYFCPEENIRHIPTLRTICDFLVLYVHAGHEFILSPSPRIRKAYRAFIDAGADLVIGHHPHVPQGIENYGKGWIAYSLGNVVFDSPYVSQFPDTDHAYLLKVNICKRMVNQIEIVPFSLTEAVVAESRSDEELEKYETFLKEISGRVVDDALFLKAWKTFVADQWNSRRRNIYLEFSGRLADKSDVDFPRYCRNGFACPTHQEVMEATMLMIENGELER